MFTIIQLETPPVAVEPTWRLVPLSLMDVPPTVPPTSRTVRTGKNDMEFHESSPLLRDLFPKETWHTVAIFTLQKFPKTLSFSGRKSPAAKLMPTKNSVVFFDFLGFRCFFFRKKKPTEINSGPRPHKRSLYHWKTHSVHHALDFAVDFFFGF